MDLPSCWEIEECGHKKDGEEVYKLVECIAFKENLGHSCWCVAENEEICKRCEVYKRYNRISGEHAQRIKIEFPIEQAKYERIINDGLRHLVNTGSEQTLEGE